MYTCKPQCIFQASLMVNSVTYNMCYCFITQDCQHSSTVYMYVGMTLVAHKEIVLYSHFDFIGDMHYTHVYYCTTSRKNHK